MVVQALKNRALERVILKNRLKCKRTVSTETTIPGKTAPHQVYVLQKLYMTFLIAGSDKSMNHVWFLAVRLNLDAITRFCEADDMKEALSIETERMDDIPLLLTHMQRMKVAELLDTHIPAHGHRKGLSVGELCVVWLAHILSQADHRMNQVQEWAMRRTETLRGCGMAAVCRQDLTDDRLADLLRLLSMTFIGRPLSRN